MRFPVHSILLLLFVTHLTHTEFGGWSIDKEIFLYIRNLLPAGKTIVELGSGWTSGEFSKYYTVYSIEHNPQWVGKFATNYIYAPIINGWYDTSVLAEHLPDHYDLILVDGPTGTIGRGGFLTNLELFRSDVPIIIDDVHREAEHSLMVQVSEALHRHYTLFSTKNKQFGVILP